MKKIITIIFLFVSVFCLGQQYINDNTFYVDGQGNVKTNGNIKAKTRNVSTTQSLTKLDNIVFASGDITLTLPTVSASDSGLSITVKNIGTYTDMITVAGTIDSTTNSLLTRWRGRTYIVDKSGAWVIREKETRADNLLDVSTKGSWTTLAEITAYLNEHISSPTVVRLGAGTYPVNSTIVCNWAYPVTFEGLAFNETNITAATGLANKPMFRCLTDVSFKSLVIDGSTLASYGTALGEDGIRILSSGGYSEITDCIIKGFYKGVLDSTNNELFLFNSDIENCNYAGFVLHSGVDSTKVRIAIVDFIHNRRGILLQNGNICYIDIDGGCNFINSVATDTGVIYRPATFTNTYFGHLTGTSYNNIGVYASGWDYNLNSGRDAVWFDQSNAGRENYSPHFKINVLNSTDTTRLATNTLWYKVKFTGTIVENCKWSITAGTAANKTTYLPTNKRAVWMLITGNFSGANTNRVYNYGICKNGIKTTRYGEQTLKYNITGGDNIQFMCFVYLDGVSQNDYFEFYWNGGSSGDVITISDLNWGSWVQ